MPARRLEFHLQPLQQDKAIALQQVVKECFSQLQQKQIVTLGDSPNDRSLFDANKFLLSVGVANILHYRDLLQHQPVYVTNKAEVEGFRELAELLITTREKPNYTPCLKVIKELAREYKQ
ncbi:hypothetical protein IQ238_14700 [Pleurocapsales cyanobacterium LEGE 06147]|nr:hypothetical protein [Pleurocapsales cyanobacterium LEGE 06147]